MFVHKHLRKKCQHLQRLEAEVYGKAGTSGFKCTESFSMLCSLVSECRVLAGQKDAQVQTSGQHSRQCGIWSGITQTLSLQSWKSIISEEKWGKVNVSWHLDNLHFFKLQMLGLSSTCSSRRAPLLPSHCVARIVLCTAVPLFQRECRKGMHVPSRSILFFICITL